MTEVITFTERGIYCPAGDFYIDPWRPVGRAVITHGHADHARPGMGHYLATHAALPVMRLRLGAIAAQGLNYGETCQIGAARVSLHPAGHVPGSAQVRVEVGGEVWVVSGDYKVEADGVSEPFAPVACHSFISECTFGLPLFRWQPQAEIAAEIAALELPGGGSLRRRLAESAEAVARESGGCVTAESLLEAAAGASAAAPAWWNTPSTNA